jgi:two-component system, response regulator, stage 0 sporulation protein F
MSDIMHNILIVDDEKNIRTLYKETFAKEGYEVSIAENGKECLEACKAKKPDLIILDIKLPDIDGMKVLEKMTEMKIRVPVILNSAYAGYEDNVNSWLAEAYIIKSGDLKELKSKVKELLGKS